LTSNCNYQQTPRGRRNCQSYKTTFTSVSCPCQAHCNRTHSPVIASMSTFLRVFSTWKRVLRIRALKQHARCNTCAIHTRELSLARTAAEKGKVKAKIQSHLSSMFADRALEQRLNGLSEAGADLLKLDIDGCDQSKFRLPRGLANSKQLSACWRPTLHLSGVLAWGVTALQKYNRLARTQEKRTLREHWPTADGAL
jgi:hypothetical protein